MLSARHCWSSVLWSRRHCPADAPETRGLRSPVRERQDMAFSMQSSHSVLALLSGAFVRPRDKSTCYIGWRRLTIACGGVRLNSRRLFLLPDFDAVEVRLAKVPRHSSRLRSFRATLCLGGVLSASAGSGPSGIIISCACEPEHDSYNADLMWLQHDEKLEYLRVRDRFDAGQTAVRPSTDASRW